MTVLLAAEYIGIASASLSGYYYAVRKGCDLLGIFIACFFTALAGGLIRDVFVSRLPYSFTHYMPLSIVLVVITLAIVFKLHRRAEYEKKFLFIFTDAIDLVSFSIVGSIVALEHGLNIYGVVLIGFFNGAGGGFVRDITFNEVPWFLKTGLYGSISMFVSFLYFIFYHIGIAENFLVFALLMVVGITFRMFAYYRGWHLPVIK